MPHRFTIFLLAIGLSGVAISASVLADQPAADRPIIRVHKLIPRFEAVAFPGMHSTGPDVALGVAAGSAEQLIYSNTLGEFVFAPGSGVRISDDITTTTDATCSLSRFEFPVSGNSNGLGTGPFGVDFALFDGCPDLDGAVIAGTAGHFEAPDERDYLVSVEIPLELDIPIAHPLWLSLSFSRANAGWFAGAPALTGFSDDVFDFPGHGCGVSFGRYPANPHASFWARVYGRGECLDAFQGYRALSPARGRLAPGLGMLIADDIQLGVDQCAMSAFEIGVGGGGGFTVDLRVPGSESSIPGTRRTVVLSGDSPELARFEFDPPISIPSEVWMTVLTDDHSGEVVLLSRPPAIGTTDEFYRAHFGGAWMPITYPDDWFYFAIQASITCAGPAPLGACCDMQFPDEAGDSVCRDVPEVNCPFPRWIGGATCDPDPFDPPCGKSACCLGDGRCEDRTANLCEVGGAGWHRGEFCSSPELECPFVCTYSEEPCSRPHEGVACMDPHCCEEVCSQDSFCCLVEWDVGCANSAMLDCTIPPENDECWSPIPGFGAMEIAVPSSTKAGVLHATETPEDPGFCCHTDTPGAQGYGTVWFKFVATHPTVYLRTCFSNAPAADSLIQLFRAENAETDEAACNSLVPVACNDDVQFCSSSDANSELGATGLVPGETYYIMLAAKTQDTRGLYQLDISAPVSLPPSCQCGEVRWLDPPDGVVDARRPHSPRAVGQPQGIDEFVVAAPSHDADPGCWILCETDDAGVANSVVDVINNDDGTYTLLLDWPLTPGAVATISYVADTGEVTTGTFTSHPANVTGDGEANTLDIAAMIDALNGTSPPWGRYSTDCDHSGSTTPADLLCVIDLLNGGDAFDPGWNGTIRPTADGVCP